MIAYSNNYELAVIKAVVNYRRVGFSFNAISSKFSELQRDIGDPKDGFYLSIKDALGVVLTKVSDVSIKGEFDFIAEVVNKR